MPVKVRTPTYLTSSADNLDGIEGLPSEQIDAGDARDAGAPPPMSFHLDRPSMYTARFQPPSLFRETSWGGQKLMVAGGLMILAPDTAGISTDEMRVRERIELRRILGRLFETKKPAVVILGGPSGTGKTFNAQAVLNEFRAPPMPARIVEYDSIEGMLDHFQGLTLVNITTKGLEQLPLFLLKKHIRPSDVVYFHAKPLSSSQISESKRAQRPFVRVQIGEKQFHFFRDPIPPAHELSPMSIRVTNEDNPLLRAMLFNRFRHPDTVENGDLLEESVALNFQIASHWFEDLQGLFRFGTMDMAQMLHILHNIKDSGIADRAMPDARTQITAMRLAIALIFFTNRKAGDIDWFETLRWAVGKNVILDTLRELVSLNSVSLQIGTSEINGNFLYDYERVETLIQFILLKTNKDIISARDQKVFVFAGQAI